jgi:hypothetical protein
MLVVWQHETKPPAQLKMGSEFVPATQEKLYNLTRPSARKKNH